jgi:hypothetical protein
MNYQSLLSYAELPKDQIQDILDIDPAKQSPERMGGTAQLLGSELLTFRQHLYAAPQRSCCLLQQFSLPLPSDQAALPRSEIIPRERDQRSDQFLNPIAPPGGNPELGNATSRRGAQ